MTYREVPFQTVRASEERLPVLQGKTAIVTGAGSGIGRSVARLFASEGANVIVADHDSAGGEETVAAIEAADGRACFVPGDVCAPQYHFGLATFAKHRYGWLDIAINIGGVSSPPTPLAGISLATWDEITAANLSAVFYAVRAQIPAMIEAGGGVIVNLANIAGAAGHGAYSASTQGLIGLTKGIAAEYANQGIRANAVVSGHIDGRSGKHPAGKPAKRAPTHATSRLETMVEVAQAALFLASPKSSFVNGICMPINGGTLAQ